MKSTFLENVYFCFLIGLILSLPASWLTHIICSLMDEKWGFLIAGALFFPIGIIHGFGIWFGVW